MKKIYIAMTALAAVALVSCEKEKSFDETPLGKNEYRIALMSSAPTKSMAPQKFSYYAGKDENTGESFYLEEVVENLNYTSGPATKGTPAYTENVGMLYKEMHVLAKGGASDLESNFWVMDSAQQTDAGWRYQGMFEWEQDSYDFYLGMPANMVGVSNPIFENNTITFDYQALDNSSATDLQDLIFAARTITKAEAEANRTNGVPVLFHHALTGVKFRIANNDELTHGKPGHTQTYITKVTITGLKNSGTCTITPREETNGYVDDPTGDYSSGDGTFTSGVVSWSYGEGTTGTYTQSFTEEQNITAYSGGSFANNGNYPDSFSGAGATYNLNDADASMTFWFVPQALTEDVVLTVEFHVWDGDQNRDTKTLTLNLGEEVLKKEGTELTLTRDWMAGQLRTFSLKPTTVDVEIEDEMDEYVKSNVYIKNTGNVSEYVRVYIIGNWVGYRQTDEGDYNTYESVLMGYTDNEMENGVYKNHDEVARWNDKDFTGTDGNKTYEPWTSPSGRTYDYEPYGEFVGLPPMGTKQAGGTMINNWRRHDKFYYYTIAIGPGDELPDTDPLFESYTVGESPDFWIADNAGVRRLAKDVHLVMDLAVQAVPSVDENGNPLTYEQAWARALNPDNDPDWNFNDL
jgi:hypothetical protein